MLVALIASVASSCGDDEMPTNPSGVPNAAGAYRGTYRIRTCTETATVTSNVCGPLTGATATTQPMQLSIQQINDQLIGNLQFSGWYTRSMILNGSINPDGVIVMNGTTPWVDAACPQVTNTVTVSPFTATLTRAQDGMSGDFKFVGSARVSPTACVFAEVTIEADSVTLTKQ